MSYIDDDEIENTPENGTNEGKPKYVKRLNFGQSILNLNTVDRQGIFNNNNFRIENNVARIPSTEKEDFVRRWVEVHNCNSDLSSNGSNQLSPVLGAPKLKQIETSPILGVCNYQNRIRLKSTNDVMKKQVRNLIETSPVLGSLKQRNRRKLHFTSEKNQADICTDDGESTRSNPLFTDSRHGNLPNANVNSSPVLVRNAYCYKRKRRRTISGDGQAHKLIAAAKKMDDSTDKNMNLLAPLNISKNPNPSSPEILSSTAKYRRRNGKNDKIYNREQNSLVCPSPSSAMLGKNKIKKNSLKDNTSHMIESVSSSDSNANDLSANHDDGKSDIIEEIDTQETDLLAKTSTSRTMHKWIVASPKSSDVMAYLEVESNKNKTSSEIEIKEDVASSKDSDKTLFSKAESSGMCSNNSQDKISQVTAISTQTNFAINVTSSLGMNSCTGMSSQIIDSCKKKRRVKKKSLARKLQTLISKQTSYVRIWHHKMRQTDIDGTSMPHIVVYVDKCAVHFYRLLLEGIVLDDPFNIFNNNESNEKSNISEPSSTKQSNKMITMFITPDIVGRIEIKSESIVKVFPPWDTMDKSKMVLNVTRIKIMSDEQRNLILSKIKIPDRKKDRVLMKEFNCPCFEADKILPSCKERLNNEKPNVMEELFKF